MEKRVKQCIGIDCAKDELVCSFGIRKENFDDEILSNTKFKNNAVGFKKLVDWGNKLSSPETEIVYLIEATGVYHEKIALYLFESKCKICVLLPNKVKAFYKTLTVKTVNDKECGKVITRFGLEKKVDLWEPPNAVYSQIKQLTRERDQLMVEQTQKKNQLHAEKSGAWPNKGSIKRSQQILNMMAKQIKEIEKEIAIIISSNEWLNNKVKKLCSIKGVGLVTAATVLGETNGFNMIRNKNQLVSYAGLDVVEKESGTSVKGKPRMSGKGNKYLRKCLYFPAFTSIKYYKHSKDLYKRIVSKSGIKMKAAVAVQRKMLVLMYVLWKKDEMFNPEYHLIKKEEQHQGAALHELT